MRRVILMTKQWQTDEGYLIKLTLCETRSRIEVRDRTGSSLLYREYEYWQRNQAEKEAAALVRIAAAHAV